MRWGREMDFVQICVILTVVLYCDGHSNQGRKAQHFRRYSNPGEPSVILGAPKFPYHLPPAEPVLPGHTLIRPAAGMLKSAVKFPHREHENGSGVYGDFENLGIKYDGRNERVLYSGFRRSSLGDPRNVMWIRNNYPFKPRVKKRKPSTNLSNNSENKTLTTLPALPGILREIKFKPKKDKPLRFLEEVPVYLIRSNPYYNENIEVHILEGANLLNFLRHLTSFSQRRVDHDTSDERLQNLEEQFPWPKKYVSGKVKNGQFSILQPDYEDGEIWNKTAMFWKTKDAFNHIKISPESPDHSDLLPPEATEKLKPWWFYNQSDLEELDDK